MNKNSTKTVLLCGLAAIIVTIIFYLLAFKNIFTLPMRWLSLLFLLLVEALVTLKVLKFNNSILGAANVIAGLIHLGIVLAVSLVFVNLFPFLIKEYVLLNLLLIGVVAAVDILLSHFDSKADESNRKYSKTASVVDECLNNAHELLLESRLAEYKDDIADIIEMLKYSNRTAQYGNEEHILMSLDEVRYLMDSEDKSGIKDKLDEIKNMIKLSSLQTKKRGKF